MDELIERLRNFENSDALGAGDFSLMHEAAAAIEALRAERAEAENKQLREELSKMRAEPSDETLRLASSIIGKHFKLPGNACRAHAAIAEVLRAQPAASAELRCRKCGELARVVISSARVMTHWPDGAARDERDIASDPEGTLIHAPSEPLRAAPVATLEREQSDEALLRQALEALERGAWDTLSGRNAAFAIRERLGLGQEE